MMHRLHTWIGKMHLLTRITLADQALVSGCNFLQGILIVRLAGLETYGAFALAWMGVLLGSSLQQAAILSPMMTLSGKETPEKRAVYFAATEKLNLLFVLGAGMLAAVLAIPGLYFDSKDTALLFPALPAAMMSFLLQEYVRRRLFMEQKAAMAFISDLIAYPGMLLGIGLLSYAGLLNAGSVLGAVALSFAAGSLVARPQRPKVKSDMWEVLKKHWHFSRWLMGQSLLQFFAGNYFLLAAGALLGNATLGALRAVQNLMGLTHILFLSMENIVPLRAAQAYAKDGPGGMKSYLFALGKRSGLVVGLILAGIALGAPWLLQISYGAEYQPYAYLLMLYCLLYVLVFPGYFLRYALRTLEYTGPIFTAYVWSTAFSLLCAHTIVSAWGAPGVVAGLAAAQVIMQGTYLILLYKRLRPDPFSSH
ncbi:MAG: hypothetical protein EAZ89_17550 [Bacteroidetes bacterium]|nr:MAG: hypothetical protein EAZ89_17550 [Bacteroidota bacterium]